MRGRGLGFAITAVPVAALIALMAWALTQVWLSRSWW